jgi:glucan phosphoethanolaminetransferase (alkaline phosphatase superfamily)
MATERKNQNLLLTASNFNKILFFFFLIFQALTLIICFQYDLVYSLPIIAIFLILLFFILGKNRLKILLLFTILFASLLTQPTSRKLFFLRLEEIPFFLLLFLTILAFARKERYHLQTESDYLLLGFLLLTLFSLFYGILLGNPIFRAIDDFLVLFYYAFYFLVLIYFQEERWQKILIITIIVVSVLVSLEYVLPFLLTFQIKRYATDQQHLFNLGYPLLFSYILFGKKSKI